MGCEIVRQQNRAEERARDVLRYETARHGDYSQLWSGHRPRSLKNKSRTRLRESEKPGDADVRRIDFDFNKNAICEPARAEIARARLGGAVSRSRAMRRTFARLADQDRRIPWCWSAKNNRSLSANFFQYQKTFTGEFFSITKKLYRDDATDHRDLLRAGSGEKGEAHKGHSDFVSACQRHYRAFASPPGGSFIQCDPKNPRSPLRCTPDGW